MIALVPHRRHGADESLLDLREEVDTNVIMDEQGEDIGGTQIGHHIVLRGHAVDKRIERINGEALSKVARQRHDGDQGR